MIIIYWLYNLVWLVMAVPFFLGFGIRALVTGRRRREFFGHFGIGRGPAGPRRPTVWVHAMSLGEMKSIREVVRQIRERRPDVCIVATAATDLGLDYARSGSFPADAAVRAPMDFPPGMRLFLARWRPALLIAVETDIWPNLVRMTRNTGARVVLVNGRVSEKTHRRMLRLAGPFRFLFGHFDLLVMRDAEGVRRMAKLGLPREKLATFGEIKTDAEVPPPEAGARLRRDLGLTDRPVLVAGSTHPGEEEILLDAFAALRKEFPTLAMIVAPRRTERAAEVERLGRERGFAVVRRSTGVAAAGTDIFLIDTVGELAAFYGAGDVAFVGRSLVPPGGGHNVLEPAAQGRAVLHGPFMANQADDARRLGEAGVARVVRDATDIARAAGALLRDPAARERARAAAFRHFENQRGASGRVAGAILSILPDFPLHPSRHPIKSGGSRRVGGS
ncbi:MAG: glycosyltransferase N-terminal domain-containing protein [Planctomycetota bacterium]